MKKLLLALMLVSAITIGTTTRAFAQDAAPAAATGAIVGADGKTPVATEAPKGASFWQIVIGSGAVGFMLWVALFASGAFAAYFIVDGYILVRPKKIMPQELIDNVRGAMDEGDLMLALDLCAKDPSSLSKILTAGFSHVTEGFDVIEEAIHSAAELEVEALMQRLNWISVCANSAPMLGLLGTVQGMILTFATLALSTGTPEMSSLALNISQALYTTAGGLIVAIPSVVFFYSLRNNANRLILRMQVLTTELVKNLRNVEIEAE